MELRLIENTFNSYGPSWALRPLSAVFELEQKNFGIAVQEIELTICLPNSLPFSSQNVNRSLESNYNNFQDYLNELPKRCFIRKKQILSIKTKSDFLSAEQIKPRTKEEYAVRNAKYFYEYNMIALELLTSEIKACKAKFKTTDKFDFNAFVTWLEALEGRIPKNVTDADRQIEKWQIQRKQAYEKLSDWEKLGLDWGEFHPSARELIADPKLWDIAHDFAPNGNDTGADVLEMVREIKNHNSLLNNGDEKFYQTIWRDWGFSPPSLDWPNNSTEYHVHRELIVGLAFALIKLKGECPNWSKTRAIEETMAYVGYLQTNELKWPHRQECLEYQALILSALERL